jgi:hypothetical protein
MIKSMKKAENVKMLKNSGSHKVIESPKVGERYAVKKS